MRHSARIGILLASLMVCGSAGFAQEIRCYKKKCVEYPDGSKVCELKPVDCDQVQIQ